MRRVHAHKSAAVRTRLLNRNLARGRPHRDELLRHDFGVLHKLAIQRNRLIFHIDNRALNQLAFRVNRDRLKQRNGFSGF